MPTLRSICHGGIWRSPTRALIDFAHGRASAKVMSDIGAIESGRWHASHFSWKIGAMSFVNVGVFGRVRGSGRRRQQQRCGQRPGAERDVPCELMLRLASCSCSLSPYSTVERSL